MQKLIIIGALPASLTNFRQELLKAFVAQKLEVIAMASGATAEEIAKIEALGVKYIDFPVQRTGLNPFSDLKTYFTLKRIFKQEKPDHVFAYTIKPIIWGGLAARGFKTIKFHALITGLGFAFQSGSKLKNMLIKVVSGLYKAALLNAETVIFQNNDNRVVFVDRQLVDERQTHLVNGSGVDVRRFKFSPMNVNQTNVNQTQFLLIARLLKDKGIAEYIAAAAQVRRDHPEAVFSLLGPEDASPNCFPMEEIQKHHDLGTIQYLGKTTNVLPYIEACQIYVLPSYHEGLPRTVIEAMAVGRPILTTDAPGCKDTVNDGENGFLVPIKDSNALANKMNWFIKHKDQWQTMADNSRRIAEDKFDVHKVNVGILRIMGLDK